MTIEKKVVLVSGGSRGLGAALVTKFLEDGYITATFSRSATPLIEQYIAADPEGENFYWEALDGSCQTSLKRFVGNVVRRYRRIDVMINNAGIGSEGVLPTMRSNDIETLINLNLKGAIYLAQACSKMMLTRQSGCIINISSVNAIRGHSGVSVYSATKAGLDGFTRSLARELGPKGIRVNSVAPGYFESDMVQHLEEKQKSRIIGRTPLRRMGTTMDIANLILFLTSPQASFITGQTITIDGGITC